MIYITYTNIKTGKILFKTTKLNQFTDKQLIMLKNQITEIQLKRCGYN